jgi:hypothetical protein
MTNYGPNDRDSRDGPNKGETLEGKVARETADGAEEIATHDEGLGEPVQSREAGFAQHARKGQAESPKQTNHFEPPRGTNKQQP